MHSILNEPFPCALAWFGLSFILAVIFMRALKPQREIPALFSIFGFTTILGSVIYAVWLQFNPWKSGGGEIWPFVLINTTAFLSYLIVHTAVESDSPSIILVLHLWKVKKCSKADVISLLRASRPSAHRAEMLKKSLLTVTEKDKLKLSLFGRSFLRIITIFRQISGKKFS